MTKLTLHEEYLREHPDGYKYSTFKCAVRRQKYHVRVVGHVYHLAGDHQFEEDEFTKILNKRLSL